MPAAGEIVQLVDEITVVAARVQVHRKLQGCDREYDSSHSRCNPFARRRPHHGTALEQRRWPPGPGFTFFFGHRFNVFDVGARLRKNMMQIVSDADKQVTLPEEIAYA